MLQASPRSIAETPVLTVGFSTRPLAAGIIISSCTVTAEAGPLPSTVKDSNPSATLMGSPAINAQPLAIATPNGPVIVPAGQAISQQMQNGLAGANYVYRFKAVLSDGTSAEEDVLQSVSAYVPNP